MSSKSVWNRLHLEIQIMIVFRNGNKFNQIWEMIVKRLTPSILIFKFVFFYTYLAFRRGSMGSIFLEFLFSVALNCIIAQAIYFRNCCYKIFSAYLHFCLNYVTCQLKHTIIYLKNKWFVQNSRNFWNKNCFYFSSCVYHKIPIIIIYWEKKRKFQ